MLFADLLGFQSQGFIHLLPVIHSATAVVYSFALPVARTGQPSVLVTAAMTFDWQSELSVVMAPSGTSPINKVPTTDTRIRSFAQVLSPVSPAITAPLPQLVLKGDSLSLKITEEVSCQGY